MQNNQDLAVSFQGVSKVYKTYRQPVDRLKEALARGKKVYHQTVVALEDVSFVVPRGVTFGVVGRNGSGKSTVLQIIAGVLQPSCGEVQVRGRVSALLELGSGFNPEFSGIDNIYLYASILGLTKDEVDQKLQGILDFADIGDFVHQPVKIYSSGMVVRLAFSVAVAIDPEILIVDEALSVGDALFQHKCIMRMREIMARGATVIFVSHDLSLVKALCTHAVLLERGKLVAQGTAEDVARAYQKVLFHDELSKNEKSLGSEFGAIGKASPSSSDSSAADASELPITLSSAQIEQFRVQANKFRLGTGEARVVYAEIVDQAGEVTTLVNYGERFGIRLYVDFYAPVESAVGGFNLRNDKGEDVIVSNSHIENLSLRNVAAGERLVVQFELENILRDAHYSLSVAATSEDFFHQVRHFDWVDHAIIVRTARPVSTIVYGQIYPTDVSIRASRGGVAQLSQESARASNEV